jgi:hypothetical protein
MSLARQQMNDGLRSDHWSERAKGRNRRILLVAVRSGEGLLTEHITATQAQPPERVFMPLSRPPQSSLRSRTWEWWSCRLAQREP